MSDRDSLYDNPLGRVADFSFDSRVARVFPDMIERSVPGYRTVIGMTGVIAERYAQPGSSCYDLGCSLGAGTLAMAQQLTEKSCRIVAVDSAQAMLDRCREIVAAAAPTVPVELVQGDIRDISVSNASVAVLNYTLQFIPTAQRAALLQRIYQGMLPGGVLLLSEKICFEDTHLQQLNTDLHHAFKRAHGYSDLAISQKRSALENVLQPEPIARHRQRLLQAGFSSADVWFQCFNFASLVAVK